MLPGGVDASGRCIRRIVRTRDVARMGNCASFVEKGVEASENGVDVPVAAAAIPPAFNDTLVVSENSDCTIGGKGESEDGVGEELKTHCFCPANVSGIRLDTSSVDPQVLAG